MKSDGPRTELKLSRAVEEPIEATFELGEELHKYSGNLGKLFIIGILGCIFTILFLAQNTVYIMIRFADIYRGNVSLTALEFFVLSMSGIMLIFIIALTATIVIYLIQINEFYSHLSSRYKLMSELTTKPGEVKKSKPTRKRIEEEFDEADGPVKGHLKNPIFAMLDLVEESMHELHQLIRLFTISKFFAVVILIFIEINFIAKLLLDKSLFFVLGRWELGLNVLFIIFIILTIYLLWVSEQLFRYMDSRHEIIDSIRYGESSRVPEGSDNVSRLIKQLSTNDPFIKHSGAAETGWNVGKIVKTGPSGQSYKFDAYFSADNKLRNLSDKLCIPGGRFSVFIKKFDSDISFESIESYRKAVMDVSEKDNTFPLRIIALQSNISEIDDNVYNYVLENPIRKANCGSHMQIIAEDGEVYSFIPQISYGKVEQPD